VSSSLLFFFLILLCLDVTQAADLMWGPSLTQSWIWRQDSSALKSLLLGWQAPTLAVKWLTKLQSSVSTSHHLLAYQLSHLTSLVVYSLRALNARLSELPQAVLKRAVEDLVTLVDNSAHLGKWSSSVVRRVVQVLRHVPVLRQQALAQQETVADLTQTKGLLLVRLLSLVQPMDDSVKSALSQTYVKVVLTGLRAKPQSSQLNDFVPLLKQLKPRDDELFKTLYLPNISRLIKRNAELALVVCDHFFSHVQVNVAPYFKEHLQSVLLDQVQNKDDVQRQQAEHIFERLMQLIVVDDTTDSRDQVGQLVTDLISKTWSVLTSTADLALNKTTLSTNSVLANKTVKYLAAWYQRSGLVHAMRAAAIPCVTHGVKLSSGVIEQHVALMMKAAKTEANTDVLARYLQAIGIWLSLYTGDSYANEVVQFFKDGVSDTAGK